MEVIYRPNLTFLNFRIDAVALQSGVNVIDTAPWYGNGKSEEMLGKALEGIPRQVLPFTNPSAFPAVSPTLTHPWQAYYLHTKVRDIDVYQKLMRILVFLVTLRNGTAGRNQLANPAAAPAPATTTTD